MVKLTFLATEYHLRFSSEDFSINLYDLMPILIHPVTTVSSSIKDSLHNDGF